MEEFLCEQHRTMYEQVEVFESEDIEVPWKDIIRFDFQCKIMRWTTGKYFHVHFNMEQTRSETIGKFITTNPDPDYFRPVSKKNLTMLQFNKGTIYHQHFLMEYEEEIQGLTSHSVFLHTIDEEEQAKKYNYWNFTDEHMWDDLHHGFWFANETSLLFQS